MRKTNSEHIGIVLQQALREMGLEKPLLEHRVVEAWPSLMGNMIAQYTRKVELKNGVLFVYLTSAPLRQELFLARFELVKRLNEHVGADIVQDVRLL